MAENNSEISLDALEKLASRNRKESQTLQTSLTNIAGVDFSGLTQEIDSFKLGLNKNQTLTLLDGEDKNILASVSKEGEAPAAYFVEENGKISLNLSKTQYENLKSSNPSLELPEGEENGDFLRFEIEKLKLSENLNLQDVQIKGANTDFAIMFSALGCQISDGTNVGKVANTDKNPFNMAVSQKFVERALKNENGCSLDKADPAYSALLISMINMERSNASKTQEEQVLSLELEGVKLHSVPVKDKDGNVNYLNIREEGKKRFVYLHASNEITKSSTVPKFWEINEVGLERGKDTQSLCFGLKGSGNNAVTINLDMDFSENLDSLKFLKSPLEKQFEKSAENQKLKKAEGKTETLDKDDPDSSFLITKTSANSNAQVISYDGIAIMSKTAIATPTPDPTLAPDDNDGDPDKSGDVSGVVPPNNNPDDNLEAPENPDNPPNDETPEPDLNPNEEPDIPADEQPEEGQEKDAPKEEKPKEEKKEAKKEDKKKEKKEPIFSKNMLIGLFALCVLLSTILPFMQIAAIVVGSYAIFREEVKPWLVDKLKSLGKKVMKLKRKHATKDLDKQLQKEKTSWKARRLSKQLEEYETKHNQEHENAKLALQNLKNNLNKLHKQKENYENILNDPNVLDKTKDKTRKKLESLEKQIAGEEKYLNNYQEYVNKFDRKEDKFGQKMLQTQQEIKTEKENYQKKAKLKEEIKAAKDEEKIARLNYEYQQEKLNHLEKLGKNKKIRKKYDKHIQDQLKLCDETQNNSIEDAKKKTMQLIQNHKKGIVQKIQKDETRLKQLDGSLNSAVNEIAALQLSKQHLENLKAEEEKRKEKLREKAEKYNDKKSNNKVKNKDKWISSIEKQIEDKDKEIQRKVQEQEKLNGKIKEQNEKILADRKELTDFAKSVAEEKDDYSKDLNEKIIPAIQNDFSKEKENIQSEEAWLKHLAENLDQEMLQQQQEAAEIVRDHKEKLDKKQKKSQKLNELKNEGVENVSLDELTGKIEETKTPESSPSEKEKEEQDKILDGESSRKEEQKKKSNSSGRSK